MESEQNKILEALKTAMEKEKDDKECYLNAVRKSDNEAGKKTTSVTSPRRGHPPTEVRGDLPGDPKEAWHGRLFISHLISSKTTNGLVDRSL